MSLLAEIEAILPQTQCQECGFAGCRPYAQALLSQQADIDLCPPGGLAGLKALSRLLKRPMPEDLDAFKQKIRPARLAKIDESLCIGCTKCITACPVDAIVGASKKMHHIVDIDCTGCGLCVAPCPMDCISLEEISQPLYDKERARLRHEAHIQRLDKKHRHKKNHYQQKKPDTADGQKEYIQAALARVKLKRSE